MINFNQYNEPNDPYAFVNPVQFQPQGIQAGVGSTPIPQIGIDLSQMPTPLDDVTNNLLNPKYIDPMLFMKLGQGLLGDDSQQQGGMPSMPSAPIKQGGNYASMYQQFLNDYGLLGSK